MDQLRLWGEMGCQLKQENKKYKAYRLQCKAREIEGILCVYVLLALLYTVCMVCM